MKDLIKKIEGLKQGMTVEAYNDAIDDCIALLQSHLVIHAKALKKKGTEKFLILDPDINSFYEGVYPDVWAIQTTLETIRRSVPNMPADAVLVDLIILEQ